MEEQHSESMAVEWRSIPTCRGDYSVSSRGSVRNNATGRILTPSNSGPEGKQYWSVSLPVESGMRRRYVHRLVAIAFLPNPEEKPAVLHGDGDRKNNRVENLRWGSISDNSYDTVRHGGNWQANKTECKHGHAFDEANTAYTPRGLRRCRTCDRSVWRGAADRGSVSRKRTRREEKSCDTH